MSGEENPQLSEVLKYLDQYRSAVQDFWECGKRIVELAEKLAAQMPEIRGRAVLETWLLGEEVWFPGEAWPRIDGVRLNRLIEETAEQKEIEQQRHDRSNAEANVRWLRDSIPPVWEELARQSSEVKRALTMFRELPDSKSWPHPCPTLDQLDPIIVLIRRLIVRPSNQVSATASIQQPPSVGQLTDPDQISARWQQDGWPQRLKKFRKGKGDSLKQAAATCNVPFDTYRKWEGERSPLSRNIAVILRYLCLSKP